MVHLGRGHVSSGARPEGRYVAMFIYYKVLVLILWTEPESWTDGELKRWLNKVGLSLSVELETY